MQCAFCGTLINAKSAWKGASDRFYCGEFCADSEATEKPPAASAAVMPIRRRNHASSLLDHHLIRPYERLEKLLPYMRQLSGRAAASPPRETPRAA